MAEVRGAWKVGMQVEGLEELQAQFNKLGRMPKKHLTRAGRAGIAKDLQDVKANAPTGKTGNLKKSIKKKMETPNKRNKGVYRLTFDSKMTPAFRKPTTGVYGGVTPEAYYPNSVEFGYKGKHGHVKVKTMYWADKVLRQNEASSLKKVIESLSNSIDELTK
jgi:hypothetical protein